MKVILVSFLGRKEKMEILFNYLNKYETYFNEYHIYAFTHVEEDLKYIRDFRDKKKYIKLFDDVQGRLGFESIYKYCLEEDAIYIKIDDDIVFFEEDFFKDFLNFRKNNKEYLLVYPLIINNSYIAWYLQEQKLIKMSKKSNIGIEWKEKINKIKDYIKTNNIENIKNKYGKMIGDIALAQLEWGDINYCKELHQNFIDMVKENKIKDLKFLKWELDNYYPVSINVVSWFGKTLKKVFQEIGEENIIKQFLCGDELWFTLYAPIKTNMINCVYGGKIVSHFSYERQRKQGLEKTDLLKQYYDLIKLNK